MLLTQYYVLQTRIVPHNLKYIQSMITKNMTKDGIDHLALLF